MGWLGKLYKQLWSRIGGRPWTYIIRDFSFENPAMVLLIGVIAGGLLRMIWSWDWVPLVLAGFILGHLFWGKKWVKNQHEKIKAKKQV